MYGNRRLSAAGRTSTWEGVPLMRKDVILGMSIGGVMLAVVIVYLTIQT